MVPNVLDRVFTAARTAADKGAYTQEPDRHPGQPSHVPERLVPAEQARVGLGREESCFLSKHLSQGTASIFVLGSCSLAIRSFDPGSLGVSGFLLLEPGQKAPEQKAPPNLHPPHTQASSFTPSCPGLKTPMLVW